MLSEASQDLAKVKMPRVRRGGNEWLAHEGQGAGPRRWRERERWTEGMRERGERETQRDTEGGNETAREGERKRGRASVEC